MMNLYIYSYLMFKISMIFFFCSLMMSLIKISIMMEWMMFNMNSINMEIFILLDWISTLFISIVMMISSMIMLYSMIYMGQEMFLNRFIKLVILFILSMVLMIISPNLISILFGWDGLGLISYCLVIYYQNYVSFNSGMVTVLCNRIGDIGLLMGISLMFMNGSWSFYIMKFQKNYLILVLLMILLASMTKSAQIPFSVWLPLAMAAPTPVSALVHSSTLVTAGVYLMIRFNKFFIESGVGKILLYISVLTMFMSGLMANFEVDLKKIIALSTLSQLGLMMMILSAGFSELSFFHLLTHAVFKSLLFMCAGIMIHLMNNNQDIRLCGKLNEFIPFTMLSFYISSLALMGFPFLTGFYSKDLIMEMVYLMSMNLFLLIFISVSLSLTVSYSFRLFFYLYFGAMKNSFLYYKEDKLMNLSMLILLIFSMIYGVMLNWMFFFDKCLSFMEMEVKLFTLFMLILGGVLVGVVYLMNYIYIYMYSFFFSSMWFLNYMYWVIYKPFMDLSGEGFNLDKKWIEFFGKNYFLYLIKEVFLVKMNVLSTYMFMLIVIFVLIIILI